MKDELGSPESYAEALAVVFGLISKGEDLGTEEVKELSALVIAVERYEDEVLCIKPTA